MIVGTGTHEDRHLPSADVFFSHRLHLFQKFGFGDGSRNRQFFLQTDFFRDIREQVLHALDPDDSQHFFFVFGCIR